MTDNGKIASIEERIVSRLKEFSSKLEAVNEVHRLREQLAARNQAAEAMGVLERLVKRTWGFVSIQELPDERRKKRWQITTDGEDFKSYSSLIEAVLKAGGEDA